MKVMLDLDGTLTDPKEGIVGCLTRAMQVLGRPQPDPATLTRFIGPPLYEVMAELLGTNDSQLIKQGVLAYRECYNRHGYLQNRPYPEIHEVLAALASRFDQLLVVTSKPTAIARRVIEHFELMPYFGGVHGSGVHGELADKRKLIGHVLKTETITPRNTIMVGDRKHDVIGAAFNSVRSIGVLWGYGSHAELNDAGAHSLCETPSALMSCVRDVVSRDDSTI